MSDATDPSVLGPLCSAPRDLAVTACDKPDAGQLSRAISRPTTQHMTTVLLRRERAAAVRCHPPVRDALMGTLAHITPGGHTPLCSRCQEVINERLSHKHAPDRWFILAVNSSSKPSRLPTAHPNQALV